AVHLEALREPPGTGAQLPAVAVFTERLKAQMRVCAAAQMQIAHRAAPLRFGARYFDGEIAEQMLCRPAVIEERTHERDQRGATHDAAGAEIRARLRIDEGVERLPGALVHGARDPRQLMRDLALGQKALQRRVHGAAGVAFMSASPGSPST